MVEKPAVDPLFLFVQRRKTKVCTAVFSNACKVCLVGLLDSFDCV